ncbi:MAG TPA: hypothetical protein VMN99_14025 [Anaerolineales bacterium]|nr:hypothetical protein [Anaerolineales bacterium]
MEFTFSHFGYKGRVVAFVERTVDPAILGAHVGAIDLANCAATIEFAGHGYLQMSGWVQLVRSTDNAFQGKKFEMDPFDPFKLYERAPTPYCWYGTLPTLFDAPSRDERVRLDWVAHSFLAVSPPRGNRRVVTPLLGFSWGFHISDDGQVTLEPVAGLAAADWKSHIPYLRDCYPEWQFMEMLVNS